MVLRSTATGRSRKLAVYGTVLPPGGCGRLGQGEERKKALHRRLVALDLHLPGAQRLGEIAAVVGQRGQGGRVGLDGRVWPLGFPADDLEAAVSYHDEEGVLPEVQLVARSEALCGARVEHRSEGEDERIDPQCGVARPRRGAGSPAPQLGNDRLELLAPVSELIDPGSRRRGKHPAPHDPGSLELAQALGEDVGAHIRQAGAQVGEALGAKQELAHYQQRPALAYQVEGVGGGASVAVRAHGSHARDSTTGGPVPHLLRWFLKSAGCFLGPFPYASITLSQPAERRGGYY